MAKSYVWPIYERLVNRWIDMSRWPTAKKTALAMGLAVGFHAVVAVVAVRAFTTIPDLIDPVGLIVFYGAFVATSAVIFLVSAVLVSRGREGRWTVHLVIFGYGTVLMGAISGFGSASSPWLAVVPLVALLIPIFFDRRAGHLAFAFVFVGLVAVSFLELQDAVPFAPLLRLREIDAQRELGWYLGVHVTVLSVFAYIFLLIDLTVATRDRAWTGLEEVNRELAHSNAALKRGTQLIRRYVPSQLAERFLSATPEDVAGHERRMLTVFFSDVEGFTQLLDRLEPEVASQLLNEYLSAMAVIAEDFGGTVDKFVGDAVMVMFGAPGPLHTPQHAMRAVEMALAMQIRTTELARQWFDEGIQSAFCVRIGINTGIASVGNFGSEGRMDYTAIGNQVNLASRVQAHCPPGSVLLTQATWALVKDRVACEPHGDITVKGIHYPIAIYEVRGKTSAGADAPSA